LQESNEIFLLNRGNNEAANVSFNVDLPASFTHFFPEDNRLERIKMFNKVQKVLMKREQQQDLASVKESASRFRAGTHFILRRKID
jgi:hypothetical protein